MAIKWFKCSDELPKGNMVDGIICLTYPVPKCAMFGDYVDKDGKKQTGFHDFDIKLREYKVTHWAYITYPEK